MNALEKLIQDIQNDDWEAIRASKLEFIRSQDHLSVHDRGASGQILNAHEVAQNFPDKLSEILEYDIATLPCDRKEPADTIRTARMALGFSISEVAAAAGVDESVVEDAESSDTRTPIDALIDIAQVLDIDDATLSINRDSGEHTLKCRLRTYNAENEITKQDVLAFAEAAWVAQIQLKLERWLGLTPQTQISNFPKSSDYGNYMRPAWRVGYDLAEEARTILGNGSSPIFMRRVCEQLGIPVIQTALSSHIAGATISVNGVRAIVVANDRRHDDVFSRRTTIAHELGHLLWDPEDRLTTAQIDTFDMIGVDPQEDTDLDIEDRYVEQRANAFAVHFIAPIDQNWAPNVNDDTELVIHTAEYFGMSITSSVFHLENRLHRAVSANRIQSDYLDRDSWDGEESYGLGVIPVESVPDSRSGLFAHRVVRSYKNRGCTR